METTRVKKGVVLFLSFGSIAFIGFVDYWTGLLFRGNISFSLFYLFPILFISWRSGLTGGCLGAVAGSIAWHAADIIAGHISLDTHAPYWNFIFRIGFFMVLVVLVVKLKKTSDEKTRLIDDLKIALDEKEMLIREIHHRVKNNLTVVQNLLRLQSSRIHDPESRAYFDESQNRVRSISLIYERLYRAVDISRMDSGEYIHSLTREIFEGYNVHPDQIKLNVEVSDVRLDINTLIPIGLIINELISNALKYAFPDSREGKLTLSLSRGADDIFDLRVTDNGIGIPAQFDIEKSNSFGMRIVAALVRQLDGSLEIKSEKGTEFRIRFKETTIH